jgi:hypothetical protein
VWQGGFLDTTRFGPDVVLSTLCFQNPQRTC